MDHSEELKCILCFELFTRPVTLSCGHTFCQDCVETAITRQPKCPVCKQVVLGTGRLQVNFAIQKMVEAIRQKDHAPEKAFPNELPEDPHPHEPVEGPPQQNDNFFEIDPTEQRLIGFEVRAAKQAFFFPHCVYNLLLIYPHSLDLLGTLVPNQQFAAVFRSQGKVKASYVAKIEHVVKATSIGIRAIVRIQEPLKINSIESLEFEQEAQEGQPHPAATLRFDYVRGQAFRARQPAHIPPETTQQLEKIERQISYFLTRLRVTNPTVLDKIVFKSGVDAFGARLSVDWRQNAHEFVCAVSSVLRLSYPEKKMMVGQAPIDRKVAVLFDFLRHLGPHNDPIFLFDPDFDTSPGFSWGNWGLAAAVAVFLIAVLLPQVRAHLFG